MSDHFHDPADVKRLRDMKQLAPAEFQAWLGLEKIVAREDGAIPRKYRELIAVAVALTTQCPYCIDAHAKAAKKAGATREELAETAFVAAALRAGAAATHGALALRLYEEG
jgi:AhpD family alkylhydroperoxidase